MSRRPRTSVICLWDGRHVLGRVEDGLPTFTFHGVPTGLATRRQLRAAGLRPGGHDLVAQIKWRKARYGWQWAALYRIDLAVPVRAMTPAKWAALAAAMRARRTCSACREDVGYCIPRSIGQCWPCFEAAENTNENGAPPVSTTTISDGVPILGVCPDCTAEYTLTEAELLPQHPDTTRPPFVGPLSERPPCTGRGKAPVTTRRDPYIRPAGCTYYAPLAVA